jgi:hypothetical protein
LGGREGHPFSEEGSKYGCKETAKGARSIWYQLDIQLYGLVGKRLQNIFLAHGKKVLDTCSILRQRLRKKFMEVL